MQASTRECVCARTGSKRASTEWNQVQHRLPQREGRKEGEVRPKTVLIKRREEGWCTASTTSDEGVRIWLYVLSATTPDVARASKQARDTTLGDRQSCNRQPCSRQRSACIVALWELAMSTSRSGLQARLPIRAYIVCDAFGGDESGQCSTLCRCRKQEKRAVLPTTVYGCQSCPNSLRLVGGPPQAADTDDAAAGFSLWPT